MGLRLKQALAVTASLIVAGVMIGLGLWQMASYEQSTRDVSAERAAQPAVPLADSVDASGRVDDIYGRQVSATGVYQDDQVLVGTKAPLRVVNGFRMADGRYVAVVRGSVDDPGDVPPPPSGTVELKGIFLAADPQGEEGAAADADMPTVRLQALAQEWPYPLVGGYVTVSATEAETAGMKPAELVLPEAEGSATHRGYALQWWVFAVGALAIGLWSARQMAVASRRAGTPDKDESLHE